MKINDPLQNKNPQPEEEARSKYIDTEEIE